MLELEPIDHILSASLLQNRNVIRIDANSTELSKLLASQYSCDLKRNTDALCCLGCNLGLLWAVQRLAKWRGEVRKINWVFGILKLIVLYSHQVPIETITALNTDSWCQPNGTEHALGKLVNKVIISPYKELYLGKTVAESMGVGECCRESLKAIHRSIRWCELHPAPCSHRCHEAMSETGRVQCSCYEGYRLDTDAKRCIDVNECSELTHNCDQKHETCHNTEGGFQCLDRKTLPKLDMFPPGNCTTGYYFNISESRCKGKFDN